MSSPPRKPSTAGRPGNADQLRTAFLSQDFVVPGYRVTLDGQRGPVVSDHFGLKSSLTGKKNKREAEIPRFSLFLFCY